MKISIIIPLYFYNEFVENMFLSIKKQKSNDYELIVVGNSISIEDFEDFKSKITTIFFNANIDINYVFTELIGANSARRLGFEQSKGEYVFFIDSDDQFVHECVLSNLIDIINRYDTDIVSVNLQHALFKENNLQAQNVIYSFINSDTNMLISNEFEKEIIIKNYGTNICARLIKRNLLNDIVFLDVPYAQDWNISSKLFKNAESFYFVSEPYYYWVFRENSTSRVSSMTLEKHRKAFNSIVDITEYYKSTDSKNEYQYFLYDRIINFCFQYVLRCSFIDIDEGMRTANKFVKSNIQFNKTLYKNKKVLLMYVFLKFKFLMKLYIFYKPKLK